MDIIENGEKPKKEKLYKVVVTNSVLGKIVGDLTECPEDYGLCQTRSEDYCNSTGCRQCWIEALKPEEIDDK